MTYYSQHNQDQFLNEHIFNNKKEGVFPLQGREGKKRVCVCKNHKEKEKV